MVEATLASTFNTPPKKPSAPAIFQDAITVNIPIDVTVDLGVALRRTRTKRIEALYESYPALKEKDETAAEEEEEEEDDDEEGESDAEMEGEEGAEPKKKKKKIVKKDMSPQKKIPGLVPQRHEFGTIVDYLEAKYVRGVMIQNEKDAKSSKDGEEVGGGDEASKPKEDEDDEGQGSVYSESSFLDDRDLQRDVAEQVLAQTTTTKLELEGDDDFFVNVGDLDVEETELTQKHYDPLEDSPTKKTKPATKKRKKPSGDSATAKKKTAASTPPKKKVAVTKKKKNEKDKGKSTPSSSSKKKKVKKKVKVVSTKKPKIKVKQVKKEEKDDSDDSSSDEAVAAAVAASSKKTTSKKNSEEMKKLKAEADKHRKIMQKRFDSVKKMIKALTKEHLPRRPPLKSKVSITCPANKKEGDEVTFANPHIPGQRLRVQVPKGTFAGETFKVTVPVPKPSAGDDDEGVDHNKFPRDLQDELDMYAREYDVFCKHEGDWLHAKDEEYPIHLEKRKKYNQVVKEFPKNLMTPIDSEYMKKLVRRARQNKSKRTKSAAVRRQSGDAASPTPTPAPQPEKATSSPEKKPPPKVPSDNEQEEEEEVADQSDAEEEEPPAPEPPTHRTVDLPERGLVFPEVQFSTMQFLQAGSGASGAPNPS